MKKPLNQLQEIMQTKLQHSWNRPSIVSKETASASATWLRKNKQVDNGKSFEPIQKISDVKN